MPYPKAALLLLSLFLLSLHSQVVEQDSYLLNAAPGDLEAGLVYEDRLTRDSKARYELTGLYATDEDARQNTLLIAAIENIRSGSIPGMRVGLGFNLHRAYIGVLEKHYSALALKGRLAYIFETPIKTTLTARLAYAPQALCFNTTIQDYTHARLIAEMGVLHNGNLIVGYRSIRYTLKGGETYQFDDTLYLGGRFFF